LGLFASFRGHRFDGCGLQVDFELFKRW
jgi:hypothetical protein